MKKAQSIPVIITVSRETGRVIDAERAEVEKDTFRKECQEIIKISRKERGKEAEE